MTPGGAEEFMRELMTRRLHEADLGRAARAAAAGRRHSMGLPPIRLLTRGLMLVRNAARHVGAIVRCGQP
jgi:hypothetical protein